MIDRWLDWLKYDGKDAVKHLYNPAIIAAAGLWRRRLPGTVCIGITGSAGKTSTKDLLHAALAAHFRATKNDGSNNQLYNVARALLASGLHTQYLVQELGASVPGAFDPMLRLLRPSVAIVTNIGTDHFSAFRSREALAAEKGKLVASLPPAGFAVLNADDVMVSAMAANCRARVVTYGLHSEAQFRGRICSAGWPERLSVQCDYPGGSITVATRLVGDHLAGNVLAALAAAISLGVPPELAAQALGKLEAPFQRLSVHSAASGITVIRDDAKAPAWSMPAVLSFLRTARTPGRRFLVLGTISDCVGQSERIYRRTVDEALSAVEYVVLVGHRHRHLDRRIADSNGRLQRMASAQAAAQWLRTELRCGDLLLLKGSNRADHLARLALHLDQDVACWRSKCARNISCDQCRNVGVRHAPAADYEHA